MMEHCRHLIEKWGGGTVILSPRDLEAARMEKFARDLSGLGGRVMVDPQFYLPHADHERLVSHSFWPPDYSTASFDQESVNAMLTLLKRDYNDPLNSVAFILPGIKGNDINDDWFNYQNLFVQGAQNVSIRQPIYHTICLASNVLQNEEQVYNVLEYLEAWPTLDGFYLVAEPPANSYLVEDPVWLINLLDLCAGIKTLGKKLVVGYCSHQMLCLALSKVDAIASGTWLNVRSFNDEKFQMADESTSRRSLWYYCPQAFSEYQLAFLDVAYRVGKLDLLSTNSFFNSPYSSVLFSGAQPSTTNYTDREAHRQYLQCLKVQTDNITKSTYADTRQSLRMQIETSNVLINDLKRSGIRPGNRDFSNVSDFTLGAIDAFHQIRGLMQERNWTQG